jgi:hypothetical protein
MNKVVSYKLGDAAQTIDLRSEFPTFVSECEPDMKFDVTIPAVIAQWVTFDYVSQTMTFNQIPTAELSE